MTAPAPLVSVLLPVRNGGHYFAAALDSILDQQGVAFETIVIDDGSTDGTADLLRQRARPGLVVVRRGGEGLVTALNAGLEVATGQYIARMDADDIALPGRLAIQAQVLASQPDVVMAHAAADLIDGDGRPIGSLAAQQGSTQERLQILLDERGGPPIVHPTVMMRADALRSLGGYRQCPHAEDHDLWLRLIALGQFHGIDQPLLKYCQHAGGVSRQKLAEARATHMLNCVAWRYQDQTGVDLYAQEPDRYAWLRQQVERELAENGSFAVAGPQLRQAVRQWRIGTALRIAISHWRQLPVLLSNRKIRARWLEMDRRLLTRLSAAAAGPDAGISR